MTFFETGVKIVEMGFGNGTSQTIIKLQTVHIFLLWIYIKYKSQKNKVTDYFHLNNNSLSKITPTG